MKNRCLSPFFAPVTFVFAVVSAFAQNAPFTPLRVETPAEALRSHGITDLSEESLTTALRNRDPQVRTLAANKLAGDGRSDAVPAIETALADEKDLRAQAQIAEALVILHDPKGVERLRSMCTDTSMPSEGLLAAIDVLQITHSSMGVCGQTVL